MNSRVCEVCGRPSRYVAAFPFGTVSAGVVYDGGAVCSRECAEELRRRRELSAQERQERAPVPGEGDELGALDWRVARDAVALGVEQRQREREPGTLAACLEDARAHGVLDVRWSTAFSQFMALDEYERTTRRNHPGALATPARVEWLDTPATCRYTGERIAGYLYRLPHTDEQGTEWVPVEAVPLALYVGSDSAPAPVPESGE